MTHTLQALSGLEGIVVPRSPNLSEQASSLPLKVADTLCLSVDNARPVCSEQAPSLLLKVADAIGAIAQFSVEQTSSVPLKVADGEVGGGGCDVFSEDDSIR